MEAKRWCIPVARRGHFIKRSKELLLFAPSGTSGTSDLPPLSGPSGYKALGRQTVAVRKVLARSRDRAKAVVSSLVDAVMTRPADHKTIIEIVPAAELRVFDVVSLCGLAKRVTGSSIFTDLRDRC